MRPGKDGRETTSRSTDGEVLLAGNWPRQFKREITTTAGYPSWTGSNEGKGELCQPACMHVCKAVPFSLSRLALTLSPRLRSSLARPLRDNERRSFVRTGRKAGSIQATSECLQSSFLPSSGCSSCRPPVRIMGAGKETTPWDDFLLFYQIRQREGGRERRAGWLPGEDGSVGSNLQWGEQKRDRSLQVSRSELG